MAHGHFELKTDEHGNPNPKYVDLYLKKTALSVDKSLFVFLLFLLKTF